MPPPLTPELTARVSTETDTAVDYPLVQNEEEKQRLDLQNKLLLRVLGNVQVQAPIDLSNIEGGAILDSGTGSAAWLYDLAKSVPSTTELIGIDIHSNLLPSPLTTTIPPNLTFKITSIISLPSYWKNKFNLVHQRFLFASLRKNEWYEAINEIYRVLKPGIGWIQFFELDEWVDMGFELNLYHQIMLNMFKAIGTDGFYPNGYKNWKTMLEERGFVDINIKWYDSPVGKWAGQDGVDMRMNLIGLARGFKDVVLKYGGLGVLDGIDDESYEKWIERLEKEVDEGVVTKPKSRWVVICARKPSPGLE